MEEWRSKAVAEIEQSIAKTERLSRKYRKLAKTAPKLQVDEWGVWRPRRTYEYFAVFYQRLSDGGRDSIELIQKGSK